MEPRVPVTIEARLGYRNKGDPEDEWKEYATSTEIRTMDCSPPEVILQIVKQWKFFYPTIYPTERWLPLQLFTLASV